MAAVRRAPSGGLTRSTLGVAHLLPVVGLLVLAYSGCNALLSVVVLTLSVTMIGAVTSGFFQAPMDIAPNFAGEGSGLAKVPCFCP